MSIQTILNSKFSVHFSIFIGKYLPEMWGYRISRMIGNFIGGRRNWEITRNIGRNLNIVHGESLGRTDLIRSTKNVLTHAGRCYYDLYHYLTKPDELNDLVPMTDRMYELVDLSNQDQGYLVVAPHLSNFDLVVSRLVRAGFKGRVLSYPNPGSGYQLQNDIRKSYGLEITPLDQPGVNEATIEYLKNGGVAATGIDRPMMSRKRKHYVSFFGKPSPLPVGYITTALAADVPIIAVSAYMLPDGRYGFQHSDPIHLNKYPRKLDTILRNAERVLKEIEIFIKMAPEQWLMYYPVWPEPQEDGV